MAKMLILGFPGWVNSGVISSETPPPLPSVLAAAAAGTSQAISSNDRSPPPGSADAIPPSHPNSVWGLERKELGVSSRGETLGQGSSVNSPYAPSCGGGDGERKRRGQKERQRDVGEGHYSTFPVRRGKGSNVHAAGRIEPLMGPTATQIEPCYQRNVLYSSNLQSAIILILKVLKLLIWLLFFNSVS